MKHPLLVTMACTILVAQVARAADDTIVTDRPDVVESSEVVGRGRFQVETSLAFERDKSTGVTTRVRSTPTLLRLGVSDSLELRLETEGRLNATVEDERGKARERGWADVSLGVKWRMQDGDEATMVPGIAWLVHVDVDSGSAPFRGQGLRPSLRMVAEWDLPDEWSLGVMPGFIRDRNADGRRFTGGILAVVVGKSLTHELRGFAEVGATQLASARNGGNVVAFDAGLAYLLGKDMQVDLAVARGLTRQTPDFGWTVGWSMRF